MRIPNVPASSIETCIVALQVWMGFFLLTTAVQIVFPERIMSHVFVILVGSLAIGLMTYRWIRLVGARRHLVNLLYLVVGLFIGLDMAVALTEL